MPVTAQSIAKLVQREFNDFAGDRLPASDIVDMMNMAQRDIQVARPDSTSVMSSLDLVPGSTQVIPANACSFIDIHCNTEGVRKAIRKADMLLMDSVNPRWRTMSPSTVIVHYMRDERNPRTFYVFPPAADGARVDFEASNYVIDMPPPSGDGRAWETMVGDISLNDEFATALFCLTTHYAYLTDLEGVSNAALASAFLQRAEAILGVELQTKSGIAAKT